MRQLQTSDHVVSSHRTGLTVRGESNIQRNNHNPYRHPSALGVHARWGESDGTSVHDIVTMSCIAIGGAMNLPSATFKLRRLDVKCQSG